MVVFQMSSGLDDGCQAVWIHKHSFLSVLQGVFIGLAIEYVNIYITFIFYMTFISISVSISRHNWRVKKFKFLH